MSATEKSYATDALSYVAAGWAGVLPVPPKRKDPLPSGFSGYSGAYPDRDRIKEWIENGFRADCKDGQGFRHFDATDANLALRLPQTVIGIDVDSYDGKKGRECLAHAESVWGALPPTVKSTSRLDGVSGIRLYRVPAKMLFEQKIVFHTETGRLDGIEICQFSHRYVMAWPSVHPDTGRRYRWVNPDGMMASTDYPLVGSLPFLPEKWIEGLSRPPEEEITAHEDAREVVDGLNDGPRSMRVDTVLRKSVEEILSATGSRHDEALVGIGRLLRLNHEGESGVSEAMGVLEAAFLDSVSDRSGEVVAQAEWDRMLYGNRIHDKIASTPSEINDLALIMGQPVTSLAQVMEATSAKSPQEENPNKINFSEPDDDDFLMGPTTARTDYVDDDDFLMGSTLDRTYDYDDDDFLMGSSDDGYDEFDRLLMDDEGAGTAARTSWGVDELSALLDTDDFEPEQPTVGEREDKEYVIYPGKVNALVGPPESAKSWVAQFFAAQEIRKGHNVMYFDFEDSARGVVGRMRFQGLEKDQILQHFLYSDPKEALNQDSVAELFGNLDKYQPTLVILDGLGAVMAMHNHEMKDNTEYIKFFQLLLEPLTRTGAAVVVIDHVSKNADEGSSYAIGAQAKLQMITGAQIRVQAVKKFGRGKKGVLRLWVSKDRPGGVRENAESRQIKKGGDYLDYWSTVFVDATDQPHVELSMRFEEKEDADSPNGEGELKMMTERIVDFLESIDHAPSMSDTVRLVHGREADIRKGISELEHAQRIKAVDEGRGKARRLVLQASAAEVDRAADDTLMGLGGTSIPPSGEGR